MRLFAFLLASSFLPLFAMADIAAPGEFSGVAEQIQKYVDDGDAPSIAVGVVKNDQLIWAQGFGFADLEQQTPATANTIYRLASISKSFTGTGLMVAKDKGLIDLDAPANQYLHGEKLRAYVGDAKEMTLRRLANHTSGMPLHYNFFYPGSSPPSFDVTLRRYGFAYRQPGTYWEYSNLAYGVLDRIIANVSNGSWNSFMEREIYDPLGMTRTSDHVPPEYKADAAQQYGPDVAGRFSSVPHYDFDHPGASAVVSCVNDLVRYARMHMNNGQLDGVRILSQQSAKEMRKPTSVSPGRNLGYGVAFNDGEYVGQPSNSSSGGMPGVSTTLRLFPVDHTAVIVLTNGEDHEVTQGVTKSICKVLYPGVDASAPAKSNNEDISPLSEQLTGRWRGIVIRDQQDISIELSVEDSGHMTVAFENQPQRALELRPENGKELVAQTTGFFVDTHPYRDVSNLVFRLRKEGDRLVGRMSAMRGEYFALSHWVSLERND